MADSVSYLSEPPTHGKLIFHTTFGDLDVELFSSAAPFACRLFVHLCLRHHYDGLPFHRLLPTSSPRPVTGHSPPSPHPHPPTQARAHTRASASTAAASLAWPLPSLPPSPHPLPLSSQFFITLGAAEELTGQHVLFAKVTGQTVYNLGRLDEVEVKGEAPVHAPRVRGVELLLAPWEG